MIRKPFASIAVAAVVAVVLTVAARSAPTSAAGFTGRGPRLAALDGGRPLFHGSPLAPGESRSGCLSVQGQMPPASAARVHLYALGRGHGLDRFLRVAVVEGSGTCSRFHPRRVLFSGMLGSFPSTFSRGLVDAAGWSSGKAHVYRFTVRLGTDPRSQGSTVTRSFVWQVGSS
jgi:hypothetical protein